MEKLTALEASVTKLTDDEYALFRTWFWNYENDRWDTQLEKDIASEKLANLAMEALEDYKRGKFKSL